MRVDDLEDSVRQKLVEMTCSAADAALAHVPGSLLHAIGTRLLDKKVQLQDCGAHGPMGCDAQ